LRHLFPDVVPGMIATHKKTDYLLALYGMP